MEAAKREYKAGVTKLKEVDLHEEAQRWKEEQTQELIIDFDKAVAEEKASAIIVRFDGETYPLPRRAPAWLPLFVNRHGQGPKNELSDEHNLQLIEQLLGEEFAAKIVDSSNNFVSFEAVNDKILQPVFKQWGFDKARDTTKKKETTPAS